MTVANVIYFNSTKKTGSYVTDSLCVFFGDKSGQNILNFYSVLENGLKSCQVLPDSMVILCSKEQISMFQTYWENIDAKSNFLNRTIKNGTKYTKEFYFVELEKSTGILNQDISSGEGITQLDENDIPNLIIDGLQSLVNKNSVIHHAPAGHTFKHPSGKKSKLFIQTRELANSEVDVQFIARSICLLTNPFQWEELNTLYIDSMGIYPFVKQALLFANSDAEIISFHSYDSLNDVSKPQGHSAVIISASTSGNMARSLNAKGWSENEILTLIDTNIRPQVSGVLVNLNKYNKDIEKSVDGWETDIELVGEHFSYKAKPPKQVTIGIPHTPKYLKEVLKIFKLTGVNSLNSATNTKNQLLSLNPYCLLNSKDFREWLCNELSWSLPKSVNVVIYAANEPSKSIAIKSKAIIKYLYGQKVSLISSTNLNAEALTNATGTLIVSAFSGDGGVFRQISRDLREFEPSALPRHFLAGIGIPQSHNSWDRLNQFLVRNATDRQYNFSTWKCLAIGPDSIVNSWSELISLASKAQNIEVTIFSEIDEKVVTDSLDKLTEVIIGCHNTLLPSTSGEQLQITEGFLFFGDIYTKAEIPNVPQSDVMFTIAAVLQAAREHKNPIHCLKPTNYQSVIIAPETFLRFNDDILQASILRACLPSELDYSSDKHMSEIMSEFIYKIFTRHEHSFGYAALEFAAALALGKLKLKNEHFEDLIKKTISQLKQESSALLGLILMAEYNAKK
jgi:hypothetical protein